MILIQLTGLSGAGKTTIATEVERLLRNHGYPAEVIDADVYRKVISNDLGFSRKDREDNIRRLFFVGEILVKHKIIVLMAAINPFEKLRQELNQYSFVRTVWVNCDMSILKQRDTKGLYAKAYLPNNHPDKLTNLTGVNDTYDIPSAPDLVLNTHLESHNESSMKVFNFIMSQVLKPIEGIPLELGIGL